MIRTSEQAIVQALQAGDASALGSLYDSYGDVMYGLALRILGQRQEAEDLVQEVFLNLWNHCTYNPARGSFRSFLLLTIRSRALDRVRSRQGALRTAQRWIRGDIGQEFPNQPLENVVQDETTRRVQAALNELPEQQRQALKLAYYEGLTQAEIAQRLQVPLGTVKSWFRLGFTKLRKNLHDLI